MKIPAQVSRARLWLLVLSFAAVLAAYPSIGRASSEHPEAVPAAVVRLPGHVLPALARATVVRSNPGSENEPMTLTIVLRRDNQAAFDAYLHDLYDPHSKSFHKFLTQRQVANRFGPSRADYDAVLSYLSASGFRLVEGSRNRLTITFRGTRTMAERAFSVHLKDYQIGKARFYATDSDPALPAGLASHVMAIGGLSNYAQPKPALLRGPLIALTCVLAVGFVGGILYDPNTANGKACILGALALCIDENYAAAGYDPPIVANLPQCYPPFGGPVELSKSDKSGVGTSPAATIPLQSANGTGQTVGLVEFDNFHSSDISDYLSLVGQPSSQINNLSVVPVNGGTTVGPNEDEVVLDIDSIMTLAQGAKVVVYDAPFSGIGSFQGVFNKMISDGVPIISNSWAYCEDQTTSADVNSIDSIFQNAAASDITIFNGSGDSGSTCLDGSANTISVPADSPNATAVGGSSLELTPAYTYGSETWWNDAATTPPAGQGGFGTSKFFAAPAYQTGLFTKRSIPDVVANADPFHGVEICLADDGGCPNGQDYGGTSLSAPEWAALTALLNQGLGANAGFLNTKLYALANTAAFHNAASMGTDIAHVGLGSPDLSALYSSLSGQGVGPVNASASEVITVLQNGLQPPGAISPVGEPDDGTTAAEVRVTLLDSNGIAVSGKATKLEANGGSDAEVTPSSVATDSNGDAVFKVTDLDAETVTLTAVDTSDSVTVAVQPQVEFLTASAVSASIGAAPSGELNDGTSAATITVTLKDTLGRATPGKLVTISQTGSSVVTGPSPQVTDSGGNIQFKATDLTSETVTYTAVDVTDGNLPVPGSASVDFSGDPSNCSQPMPPAGAGFVLTPYATGFVADNIFYGDVNFGCTGAAGLAFDSSGNLFVNDFPTGIIYKFPPGGGVAGPSTQLNSTSLGVSLNGLAFDSGGNLYASFDATTGDFTTGSVVQINPSTGAIIRTISAGLNCPSEVVVDPLSQDLFTDDTCFGDGSNNPSIWRITDPSGASPSTSVYATLPTSPNSTIAFAPGGTIYAWADQEIAEVSGTNGPETPTVSILPGVELGGLGLLAAGSGAGTSLIGSPFVNDAGTGINNIDLTTNPLTLGNYFVTMAGSNNLAFGPNGCIYATTLTTVYKITDTAGNCDYASALASPTIVLSPTSVSPNPAKGTAQAFTASIHYVTAAAGTQVTFSVAGANAQVMQAVTNASGQASFSYVAAHAGVDTITASTTVSSTVLTSNPAVVTWGPGSDTTFVSLNQSPKGAVPGQMVNLIASLTDVSQNPATAVSGQTIDFSVGGQDCNAPTNSQGIATCQVTVSGAGMETLTASFAGSGDLLATNASTGFDVLTTPTPTATATTTPTATPTPVVGKLKISPKTLNFGDVEVGSDKVKDVKITNAGKVKKKKMPLPILIEMEGGVASPFSITEACDDDDLGPKSKGVKAGNCEVGVTFAPTEAIKYTGTLMIDDNLEPTFEKSVKLEGTGKEPKK
jgi:hypothetical protein